MSFEKIFNGLPCVHVWAAGRVNLLGEHTDYNHGLVLPMQIPQKTHVTMQIAKNRQQGSIHMFSAQVSEQFSGTALHINTAEGIIKRYINEEKKMHWSDYVIASLQIVEQLYQKETAKNIPALNIFIDSNIPVGAGVSSSSALEIAIIKAARLLLQRSWSDLRVAQMAQKAENEYVGMPCGLMDQLIISIGYKNSALFIDFSDLKKPQYEEIALFNQNSNKNTYKFSVIFSGISHKLATEDGGYKTRRLECENAAQKLGVQNLSMVPYTNISKLDILDNQTLYKRATHVITENKRVEEAVRALKNKNAKNFGSCMTESHFSQKCNFEVSTKEIDDIVNIILENHALGARLTGGGFGGSVVFLSHKNLVDTIFKKVQNEFSNVQLLV